MAACSWLLPRTSIALCLLLALSDHLFSFGATSRANALFYNSPIGGRFNHGLLHLPELKHLVERNSWRVDTLFEVDSDIDIEEDEDAYNHERHPANELLKTRKADGTKSYILGGY